jgi:transcriptional regulator with XRE-family HTH domain
MITKPMPAHVLRTVRKLYGLSQAKLAVLVGISLTAVKQIETGRLRPSANLAHRIYMQTGLDPGQLMENSFPETPFHAMGMPLSKEMFKGMQERHKESQTQEHVDQSLRHLEAVLRLLLDVSTRQGKLWALRPALQNAIQKLIADFDLEADFLRLLSQEYGLKDPWSNTSPAKSLYTIVNGELFEKQREQAEAKRREFHERQGLKNAKASAKGQEPQRNHQRAA